MVLLYVLLGKLYHLETSPLPHGSKRGV